MKLRHANRLVVLVAALGAGLSVAADAREGAVLGFTIASESPATDAGVVDRHSVKSRVLVAFDEKFAMQQQGMRVELVATDKSPSADITLAFYDARSTPPVLVATEHFSAPVGGGNRLTVKASDGTAYDVSVQYDRARLPPAR